MKDLIFTQFGNFELGYTADFEYFGIAYKDKYAFINIIGFCKL